MQQVAFAQLVRKGCGGDAPGLHQVAVVGVAQRLLDELLDEQDRQPAAAQLGGHLQDAVDDDGREAAGRLVEHQQLRCADHALPDRKNLLLPARQARRHLLAPVGQFGEQPVDAVELAAVAARVAGIGADQQVVFDAQRMEHAVPFEHLHDAGLDDGTRARVAEVAAVEVNAAGALRHQARDGVQQAALAGAVAPQHHDELTGPHVDRDAVHDLGLAVGDVQVAHFEQGLRGPLAMADIRGGHGRCRTNRSLTTRHAPR